MERTFFESFLYLTLGNSCPEHSRSVFTMVQVCERNTTDTWVGSAELTIAEELSKRLQRLIQLVSDPLLIVFHVLPAQYTSLLKADKSSAKPWGAAHIAMTQTIRSLGHVMVGQPWMPLF
jgi:hypothetical protein